MRKLHIGRKQFVSILESIQKGLEKRDKFNDAMEEISDSYFICELGNEWLDASIVLLEKAVKDKNETISWWLWEDVDKIIYIPPEHPDNPFGKELKVKVDTPNRLYSYFQQYT